MNGQASVEMMMALAAALAAAGMLCAAVLGMAAEARADEGDAAAVASAERMARAADAAINNGLVLRPDAGGGILRFRIQDGALLVRHDGRAAQAKGVFIHDDAEPV
jgi:hypothetical protein